MYNFFLIQPVSCARVSAKPLRTAKMTLHVGYTSGSFLTTGQRDSILQPSTCRGPRSRCGHLHTAWGEAEKTPGLDVFVVVVVVGGGERSGGEGWGWGVFLRPLLKAH